MKLYYPSGIAFSEKDDRKPWLWFSSDGELTLEKAVSVLESAKSAYHLISGWIDMHDLETNEKHTVFHECYIDCFGDHT